MEFGQKNLDRVEFEHREFGQREFGHKKKIFLEEWNLGTGILGRKKKI